MALNFPASPTVGTLYPQPPIGGSPVYQWDGEKWITYATLPSSRSIAQPPPKEEGDMQ